MNPIAGIWFEPRQTIGHLAPRRQPITFLALTSVYGSAYLLYRVVRRGADLSGDTSRADIVIGSLVFGAVLGPLALCVISYLATWIGRRLGGQASAQQVRVVFAWASVPIVPVVLALIALLMLAPRPFLADPNPSLALAFFRPFRFAMVSWSLVIAVVGLAEVMAFSVARSLLTHLLAGAAWVVGVVPLVLLAKLIA